VPVPIRSPHEIDAIAHAGRVVWSVLDELLAACAAGVTTRHIDALAGGLLAHLGAEPVLLGLRQGDSPPFPGVCCINVNEEVAHAIPTDRALGPGDRISVDLSAAVDGWVADACRTIVVGGGANPEGERVARAARDALARGLRRCVPGGRWSSVAAAVAGGARLAGLRLVPGLGGHGVGRLLHEPPLCWLGSGGPDFVLRPGMVLTLEPVLTGGAGRTRILDDGWTVVAADGAISAGEERTVAITRRGPRVLTGPGPGRPDEPESGGADPSCA